MARDAAARENPKPTRHCNRVYNDEKLSAISHLVGAALALAGMVLLVVYASSTGDRWKIASVTVYGVCLFFMFLF